jgi:hypothetical protein
MTLPAVHLSIRRNLLDAFGALRSDVFFFLKLATREQNLKDGMGAHRKYSAVSKDELVDAEEALRPLRVQYTQDFPRDYLYRNGAARCNPGVWQQQLAKAACYDMVLEEETRIQLNYSFIFMVRPDLLWMRRFPNWRYFTRPWWEGAYVQRDWFIMVSRKWADTAFRVRGPCWLNRDSIGEEFMLQYLRKVPLRCQCIPQTTVGCYHGPILLAGGLITGGVPGLPGFLAEPWKCLQPCTLIRLSWDENRKVFQTPKQWGCGAAVECDNLAEISVNESRNRVERWHKSEACSSPCRKKLMAGVLKDKEGMEECETTLGLYGRVD